MARAADLGLTAGGVRTEAGQLLGTLGHMSLEQASGDPAAIDPRGDVYALGVILYELLAHRLPYSLEGLSLPEAVRVIHEQGPSRLGSLDGRLRGDLETIAAKALAKDKARRYASAGELAADIRHYLNHEPIRARPVGSVARLVRACRRRPLVALLLGLLTASLFGGLGGVTWMWRKAESNLREADRQRDEADQQRAAARRAR